jgi:hypothetical protein
LQRKKSNFTEHKPAKVVTLAQQSRLTLSAIRHCHTIYLADMHSEQVFQPKMSNFNLFMRKYQKNSNGEYTIADQDSSKESRS